MDNRVLSLVLLMIKTGIPKLWHTRLLSAGMDFVSGMLLRENIPLFPACYMSVDLRCHNGTMPKQLLDVSDINTLFQQQSCKRVPEHMWRDMIFHASDLGVFINH